MKKCLLKIFLLTLLLNSFCYAEVNIVNDNNPVMANILDSNIEYKIDSKISKELKDAIRDVYGKEKADEIYQTVINKVITSINSRPEYLKNQDLNRKSDWYKDEIIYMFYVDQFGIVQQGKSNTFKDTTQMLDYLKELGVTTLYMLPFADSPMKDAGFDVKNPQTVRQDLGGMKEFTSFAKQAKAYGFKIKADLVLNHLSSEHEWFKKLEQGDESALQYFVYTDKEPKYKKYQDEKLGTVVEYTEDDGSISKRRLIFPENIENNYRKVEVNGKIYYLYHTFYPFQLDINWENPEVLYYALDTITNWTNCGIDIFRMDAIPYLIKEKGTNAENLPKTHSVIKILSDYILLTASSSVIQVEACQHPKDILPYFGKEREVDIQVNNEIKKIKRTNEAQIAYHFPYMPAIWATLITEDKKYFIDAYKNTPQTPKSTAWGMFLRVHDELTLEMVSPEVRKIVYDDLINKGLEFRKGFGVSGRLANFLDKNPNRIEVAYSILFSLPGIPIIYYGDEIGVTNNFENAKESALIRSKNKIANLLSVFDSRDINRGKVSAKLFYGSSQGFYKFNSQVYCKVHNLIQVRKSLPVMVDGDFELLQTKSKSNFAYLRKNKNKQILVINNLSKEKLYADITLPIDIILKNNGKINKLKNLINGDNIKVNISLKNKTMHLRLSPYQTLWLDVTPN
ncbi:MAG: alpha-amylase family glycosyl hydrolase [bacterium]|nr:alpha-amylase family glycosyl hydrolase [bacterium]